MARETVAALLNWGRAPRIVVIFISGMVSETGIYHYLNCFDKVEIFPAFKQGDYMSASPLAEAIHNYLK